MTAIELVCLGFPQLLTGVNPQNALHCYTPGVSSRTIPGVAAEPSDADLFLRTLWRGVRWGD